MSVKTLINTEAKQITIFVTGSFGFHIIQEFRRSYSERHDYQFTIDLRKVEYMDSTGLGILINMHNYLDQRDRNICITNTLPQVRKILAISRFDRKFKIE
ncbi:STAS domain-containing protein [Vibrio renipiscarius]|uniref:STAS domain-containing protein n=1 Tax=Vibrio renipiscarius TaxID=1461322 RepID=UPI0035504C2B